MLSRIIAAPRARAKEALFSALVKQKRGSFKGKIIFLIACPSAEPRSVLIFAQMIMISGAEMRSNGAGMLGATARAFAHHPSGRMKAQTFRASQGR